MGVFLITAFLFIGWKTWNCFVEKKYRNHTLSLVYQTKDLTDQPSDNKALRIMEAFLSVHTRQSKKKIANKLQKFLHFLNLMYHLRWLEQERVAPFFVRKIQNVGVFYETPCITVSRVFIFLRPRSITWYATHH